MGGPIVGDALTVALDLGDRVLVLAGLVVGDRGERDPAVPAVLGGLEDLAVGVLELEGELAGLEPGALEDLGRPEGGLSAPGRVLVGECGQRTRIELGAISILIFHRRAQRTIGSVALDRHHGLIAIRAVCNAGLRARNLFNGVGVRPLLVPRELVALQGHVAIGVISAASDLVVIRIGRNERELTVGQILTIKNLDSLELRFSLRLRGVIAVKSRL